MKKALDTVFALLFSLVIAGPAFVLACEEVQVPLPDWVTSESAKYLSGAEAPVEASRFLSAEGFATGQLQDALDTEISQRIPFKASALLGNAALQRASIKLANTAFGFQAYHTYYGSGDLYIPSVDAAAQQPHKKQPELDGRLLEFSQGVARVAKAYPSKRFVIFLAAGYQTPAVNPAYELCSDPLRPDHGVAIMRQAITQAGVENAVALSDAGSYESLQEYYAFYYRTDNHWNIDGTIRGYNLIADELKLPTISDYEHVAVDDIAFTGSIAREALIPLTEKPFDCAVDLSEVQVLDYGGTTISGSNHDSYFEHTLRARQSNFYGLYYNNLGTRTLLGTGEHNALVVSNSYGGSLERILAKPLKQLVRTEDLWPGIPDAGQNLAAEIERNDADYVVFVGTLLDYAEFTHRLPHYFSVDASL